MISISPEFLYDAIVEIPILDIIFNKPRFNEFKTFLNFILVSYEESFLFLHSSKTVANNK